MICYMLTLQNSVNTLHNDVITLQNFQFSVTPTICTVFPLKIRHVTNSLNFIRLVTKKHNALYLSVCVQTLEVGQKFGIVKWPLIQH